MLTSIKKVKGLGVFRDFTAAADLPAFGRFNLIYGENGSGKTTLSRLFRAIEDGDHTEYPDLAFTVATDAGDLTKGQKCPQKIRVFNSDYIEANIGQFDNPIKHILIIGEDNKALAEEIKLEQAAFDSRSARGKVLTANLEKLEKDKGKIFTTVAATIGEATSGATQRRYRKPDAEAAFALVKTFQVLTEQELEPHQATVRQEQAAEIDPVVIAEVDIGDEVSRPAIDLAGEMPARAKALTLRSAQSGALKRLSENPDIAQWVEAGREIHKAHGSERCEYCEQVIPAARLEQLAQHFGLEDQALRTDIEGALSLGRRLYAALSQVECPPKAEFYSELRDAYEAAATELDTQKAALLEAIAAVGAALNRKLGARATSYEEDLAVDVSPFAAALEAVGKFIGQHNEKSGAFEKAKATAQAAIEGHYLSTVAAQVKEFDGQIATAKAELEKVVAGDPKQDDKRSLEELAASIQVKKAQIANAHAGGELLTGHLRSFLGRTDLSFESAEDGYVVKRRGVRAKRLSEGEKTAIAFLYFIVQLKEDFDVKDGIVVIDDPISSLDSSSIYQAFAHLKNAVKDAKQVFLLTHNFDFLKLLINWVDNARAPKCYMMLVCTESADSRDAHIQRLDKLLEEHATEYHYLFKVLYSFKSDGTILTSYHIPNIARKVLETFLDYHVPSRDSLFKKLEAVAFDDNKKTAIYKFANELSHQTGKGFDPALVAETQKNSAHLLDMIETVAPLHFAGLKTLATAA